MIDTGELFDVYGDGTDGVPAGEGEPRFRLDEYGEWICDFYKAPGGGGDFLLVVDPQGAPVAYPFKYNPPIPPKYGLPGVERRWPTMGRPYPIEPGEVADLELYEPDVVQGKAAGTQIPLAIAIFLDAVVYPYQRAQEERAKAHKEAERKRKAAEKAIRRAEAKRDPYSGYSRGKRIR